MTFFQFIQKWNNKYLEYNDPSNKNQCMDLFYAYVREVLEINPSMFFGQGSAKNCYNNFDRLPGASKLFTKIPNTPTNVPKQGDVIFWGFYPGVTGWAGHVAIFWDGNVKSLTSFDQNYPTYSACHLQPHSYRGVMGWLRKK